MRRMKDLANRLTNINKAANYLVIKIRSLRDKIEIIKFIRDNKKALRVVIRKFINKISKAR